VSGVTKHKVLELLQKDDTDELLCLFDRAPNRVRKYLTMATYAEDDATRKKAVNCFGWLAKKRGMSHPEFFRETIRRHIWAMNDESGNMDWLAPEIIGQIVAAQPRMFEEFASIMIEAALKEPPFYPSLRKAVKLLAGTDKNLIQHQLSRLQELGMINENEAAG
jgi:hypothetical protein